MSIYFWLVLERKPACYHYLSWCLSTSCQNRQNQQGRAGDLESLYSQALFLLGFFFICFCLESSTFQFQFYCHYWECCNVHSGIAELLKIILWILENSNIACLVVLYWIIHLKCEGQCVMSLESLYLMRVSVWLREANLNWCIFFQKSVQSRRANRRSPNSSDC